MLREKNEGNKKERGILRGKTERKERVKQEMRQYQGNHDEREGFDHSALSLSPSLCLSPSPCLSLSFSLNHMRSQLSTQRTVAVLSHTHRKETRTAIHFKFLLRRPQSSSPTASMARRTVVMINCHRKPMASRTIGWFQEFSIFLTP